MSLFSIRGRQIADEWVQCIVKFAYVHHVHDTISIYACQRVCQSLWQHSNTEICLIDIMQHPQQHTHTPHAHMHARSHGCTLSFFGANIAAAKWLQYGIAWGCRCAECFFTTGIRVILPMVKSPAAHQQLPNVHPNLSRLQPARPSLSLMGSCAAQPPGCAFQPCVYRESLQSEFPTSKTSLCFSTYVLHSPNASLLCIWIAQHSLASPLPPTPMPREWPALPPHTSQAQRGPCAARCLSPPRSLTYHVASPLQGWRSAFGRNCCKPTRPLGVSGWSVLLWALPVVFFWDDCRACCRRHHFLQAVPCMG